MRLPVVFHFTKDYGTIIGEPVIPGRPFFGDESEYEIVLSRVKKCYKKLIEDVSKSGLKEALDTFFRGISSIAIPDESFKICLAKELNTSIERIEKAILSTNYVKERLRFLKKHFKKMRKENPIEYAEGFGELVALIGFKKTLSLLRGNGLKIGETTLRQLYKVSMYPLRVKRKIENREIPLTVAFELPLDSIEEAAESVAGLKFYEARSVLRKLKANRTY